MKKRGPVSMAALQVAAMAPKATPGARLAAPSTLTPAESDVWQRTVSCLPPEWLKADQGPVLERYVKHVVRAQALEALIAAADPVVDLDRYAKLVTLAGAETSRILSLARSLRLTVQSRLHPVTAGSRAASAMPARTPDDDRAAVLACVADARARKGGS